MDPQGYTDRIGDLLLRRQAIKTDVLETALKEAQAAGESLETYLLDKNLVPGSEITLALSQYLNIPPISLAHFVPDAHLLDLIPHEVLNRHLAVPIARVGRNLTVALGDPFDIIGIDELRSVSGLEITPLVSNQKEIQEALNRLFASASSGLDMEELMKEGDAEVAIGKEEKEEEKSIDDMLQSAEGVPVIRIVNLMLLDAVRKQASIHIEPMAKRVRLRYRVEGILMESPGPPKNLHSAVVSRIKIMSNLNIAEQRMPQDGRFRIRALGKDIDVRVSIVPTVHGEKVVMRPLDRTALYPNLASLGLDPFALEAMTHAIAQPHGILLVTGPTGCGKTTTLYSCLEELNKPDVNIVTCEDPVEYQVKGINQVQIRSDIGLTFAATLRSILRQDPDIVLVGEIRDRETADIAVRAALTGHLVLSTLHTNDAAGAVIRLVDMGVEPFLLASSLLLTQAQRLFRKLCQFCKKEVTVSPGILKVNDIPPDYFDGVTVYGSVGCPKCNRTGFKGRSAIMEVIPMDEEIRQAILRGETSKEIRTKAIRKGMITLKNAGLQKVKEGVTSLDSVLAITGGRD